MSFASIAALRRHLAQHNPDALALSAPAIDGAEQAVRTDLANEYAKLDRKARQAALSNKFMLLWNQATNCEPLRAEYKFHPTRKWRADFYHQASNSLIEIEGGTRNGGRHVRPGGYSGDVEKYNAAAALGFNVQRITSDRMTLANVVTIAKALGVVVTIVLE